MGVFKRDASKIIDTMYRLREKADHDDFYVASRKQAEDQLKKAKQFLEMISIYLEQKWKAEE